MASLSKVVTTILSRWPVIFLITLASATIFTVIALYYNQNPFLEAFEDKSYDLRFKNIRGPITPSDQIVIVAIDDASIAELGRFPWSRSNYLPLLKNLSNAGAKAILFDAFFSETEDETTDLAFAKAIKEAGNVILATHFNLDPNFKVLGHTRSLPLLEEQALGGAHINFVPEDDGVNRRNILVLEEDGKLVPSLGLRGAMAALSVDHFSVNDFSIDLGQRSIPVDYNRAMWINYIGKSGVYPLYSFSDVSNGRISPTLFKDKIVFIGATAIGIYDMRVTPFDKNTPGVETHATVADNIITGRFIQQSEIEAVIDILFITLIGLITFILTARLQLYIAIPLTLIISAGYVWIAYQFFIAGQWINIIYPMTSAFASLLVGGSFRYLILERRAREMRSIFSSYISPKLVAQLERQPDAAQIGGDTKEITIIFTDIIGFTSFSENHTPLEVVTRLNEYLAVMVKVVTENDGTVDKFMGDGIMIYWGAPLAQEAHADRAIKTVLAMMSALQRLQLKWEAEGQKPFVFRAGINSGEVIAGNIGSSGKKMEYTVIGDTVNLGARLESIAKYYGVRVIVSESSYQQAQEHYLFRELDLILVVGKHIPVKIYELITSTSPMTEEAVQQFHNALALYRSQRWQEAISAFEAVSELVCDDVPSQLYIDRCHAFMRSPPPDNWNGVFTHDKK